MGSSPVQNACEVLEDLLERDIHDEVLTTKEFHAINTVLLELTVKRKYAVPERFL